LTELFDKLKGRRFLAHSLYRKYSVNLWQTSECNQTWRVLIVIARVRQ